MVFGARCLAFVGVAAAIASCGARTELDSVPSEASGPLPASCRSNVERGASTPMRAFCSTRAHLAPTNAPTTTPAVVWSKKIGSTFQPLEAVVDSSGRTYANIDPNVMTVVQATTLVAIDPDGTIAWSHAFPGTISSLFLGSDSLLHLMVRVPAGPRTLVAMTPDGSVGSSVALPANVAGDFAIGSDGSLYTAITDFTNPDRIMKLSPNGAVVWTSPAIDAAFPASVSQLALTADDHVVAATLTGTMVIGSTILELDAQGAITWQTQIDGDYAEGPSIAGDGSIRVAGSVIRALDASPQTALVVYSLDAAGNLQWRTALGDDAEQTGDDALAIGPDGTAVFRTFTEIIAASATGAVLWRLPVYPNGYYDAAFDPSGALVVLGGHDASTLFGLDAHSGMQLWSFVAPVIFTSIAFGASGSIVALGGEGTVTLLR